METNQTREGVLTTELQYWEEFQNLTVPLPQVLPDECASTCNLLTDREADVFQRDLIGVPRKVIAATDGVLTASISNSIANTRKRLGLTREQYQNLKVHAQAQQLQTPQIYSMNLCKRVFDKSPSEVSKHYDIAEADVAVLFHEIMKVLPEKESTVLTLYLKGTSPRLIEKTLSLHHSEPSRIYHRSLAKLKTLFQDALETTSPLPSRRNTEWLRIENTAHRKAFIEYLNGKTNQEMHYPAKGYSTRAFRELILSCASKMRLSEEYIYKRHLLGRVRAVESSSRRYDEALIKTFRSLHLLADPPENLRRYNLALNGVRNGKVRPLTRFMLRLRIAGLSYHQIALCTRRSHKTCRDNVVSLIAELNIQLEQDFLSSKD